MRWLDGLNAEQKRAVLHFDGPLRIIAGPGTGKTKTLTARIAQLIASQKAQPDEILALTFTNKAAAEMTERVALLLGANQQPHIATFHALCHQLLRQAEQAIVFIDEHERSLLIRELRESAKFKDLTTRELALEISRLKNLPPGTPANTPALQTLLEAYNRTLRNRGLYDFDDLLQRTHQLLQNSSQKPAYRYILVDEFQDTNRLQYELLLLLKCNDNLCVIGDPLQSIYGFRGADGDIFERFQADFPTGTTIALTTNYRSAPEIVALSGSIFPDSPKLTAHRQTVGTVQAVKTLNEYAEAAWIISQIEKAIGGSDFLKSHELGYDGTKAPRTFRDFAVLYRTHRVAKTLQRALLESGMPFQIVGDGSPYEQPQPWALTQLLCSVASPPSDEQEAALRRQPILKNLSAAELHHLIQTLRERPDQRPSRLAQFAADLLGFEQRSLAQFIGSLVRFDTGGLTAYAQHIQQLDDTTFYEPAADTVTLTTIHAAKGLEFTHVFLLGAEEGILPHQRSNGFTNIEEERRLFYVAVTRARENLDILYTKSRSRQPAEVSRFVRTLPANFLPYIQDPAMKTNERRLQKRRAKRSQSSLFDV